SPPSHTPSHSPPRVTQHHLAPHDLRSFPTRRSSDLNRYRKAITTSKFREDLEARFGSQLFALSDNALKADDPSVISLLQKENKLSTQYDKLLASAEIEFDGKKLNLSEFAPYTQNPDRQIRKDAALAVQGFMGDNLEEID